MLFEGVRRVVTDYFAILDDDDFLLRDHFDNLSVAQSFPGPMLVIHGRDDRLIPWRQGLRLASASRHATFHLYDCGHGCWDPEHLPFWRDVIPFLLKAGVLVPDTEAAQSLLPVPES